ncbi:hypothetical protein RFI_31838 [Reticulomyxa filosa]|uniref:Uncharacterized protein n=1 Tax=Reticulomyxa filosa TaxID=46433 RepID=X6LUF7_RETFI|nr:hypothetical protein RFI_31838 [Reticulomyxa filosa]|eukprot:ETO05558.1 hypothetical protein RFI_31838 [Reticulomyxa filosa]
MNVEAEKYLRKAILYHSTNAQYHHDLMDLIASDGEARKEDLKQQKESTIEAHLREMQYFLSLAAKSTEPMSQGMVHWLFFLDTYYKKKIRYIETLQELQYKQMNVNNCQVAKTHAEYALTIAQENPELKMRIYEEVQEIFSNSSYPNMSEEYWQRALREYPNEMPTKYGIHLYEKERYKDAMKVLQEQINRCPHDLMAKIAFAKIIVQWDRFDEAKSLLTQVLKQVPNHPLAVTDMVLLFIKTKEFDKAQTLLSPVLKHYRSLASLPSSFESVSQQCTAEMESIPIPLLCLECYLLGHFGDLQQSNERMLIYADRSLSNWFINYLVAIHFRDNTLIHTARQSNRIFWLDKTEQCFRNALLLIEDRAYFACEFAQFLFDTGNRRETMVFWKTAKDKYPDMPCVQRLHFDA